MDVLIITLIVIGLILYVAFSIKRHRDNIALLETVTDRHRGTRAERKLVLDLLKYGFTSDEVFHDLFIEYRPGYYSQIDVVVLSPVGIIVFEDKDYSGWLFGSGYQKYWTQVLNYGEEKHRFYNPILQNSSHIAHLQTVMGKNAEGVPFIPYIIFHGDCELRKVDGIPAGTIVGYGHRLTRTLKSFEEMPRCSYPDIEALRRVLRKGERNGRDPEVVRRHLENLERWKNSRKY